MPTAPDFDPAPVADTPGQKTATARPVPRVGDRVDFIPGEESSVEIRPMAATVTRVFSDVEVDVEVFSGMDAQPVRFSSHVLLDGEAPVHGHTIDPGRWRWRDKGAR